jgi:hypothetical protein
MLVAEEQMLKRVMGLLVLFGAMLSAENGDRGRKRLWKWSVAVLATANAADAISSAGRYELNPVLGMGPFGARAMGIKIGISTATVGVQYLILRRHPEAARKAAIWNFGMAGLTGGIAARNAMR